MNPYWTVEFISVLERASVDRSQRLPLPDVAGQNIPIEIEPRVAMVAGEWKGLSAVPVHFSAALRQFLR
jgi:hypothetical protein